MLDAMKLLAAFVAGAAAAAGLVRWITNDPEIKAMVRVAEQS